MDVTQRREREKQRAIESERGCAVDKLDRSPSSSGRDGVVGVSGVSRAYAYAFIATCGALHANRPNQHEWAPKVVIR